MKRQYHTPDGIVVKELTDKETLELAKTGDHEALVEWAKMNWPPHSTPHEKIDILAAVLGVAAIPE